MTNSQKVTLVSRISFIIMLYILFIGLKLTNYIDWPWLWVLSPLWIGIGLSVIIFIVAIIFIPLVD